MRISRRTKAILASATVLIISRVSNATTDTWTGTTPASNPTVSYIAGSAFWNTSTTNWSNGGTNLYTVGDNVVFTDNFGGLTNLVLSGNMNPASMEFTHVTGSTPVNYLL